MSHHFDIGNITPTRYSFSVAIVLGLLFAMASSDESKAPYLVFRQWQLQALVPIALLIRAHILIIQVPTFLKLNPWVSLGLSGILAASFLHQLPLRYT